MDKDFHVDCYACQDCGIQLTDETGKRCYPLNTILLFYNCHIKRVKNDSYHGTQTLPIISIQQLIYPTQNNLK